MRNRKRFASFVLALVLCLSLLPVSVLASEDEGREGQAEVAETVETNEISDEDDDCGSESLPDCDNSTEFSNAEIFETTDNDAAEDAEGLDEERQVDEQELLSNSITPAEFEDTELLLDGAALAESQVITALSNVLTSYPNNSTWSSSFDGGKQCYGFAKLVIYNVFGKSTISGKTYRSWLYDGTSTSGMTKIGSVETCTEGNVKTLLNQAKPGDVLQFNSYNSNGHQHSMVIYSLTSTGAQIYECNWYDTNKVTLTSLTYKQIAQRQYENSTIGGTKRRGTLTLLRSDNYSVTTALSVSGAVYPSGSLTIGESFGLRGIISSGYTITNVSANIYDSVGASVLSYSQNPNSTSYNIQTDGLNDAFSFGKLAAGSYTYVVSATSNGTTKKLINSTFTVVGSTNTYPTTHPNTWNNTGNQATDIAEIAYTQVGYAEAQYSSTDKNHTKYNYWYYGYDKGDNGDASAAWCAVFVSWCADQAGIATSIIKKYAIADPAGFGIPYYLLSSVTPQKGDIAFVENNGNKNGGDYGFDHVGIVFKVDSNYIYTVEGNDNNKVTYNKYNRSNGKDVDNSNHYIYWIGRPNYKTNTTTTYTVTYNANGGTGAPTAQTKTYGTNLTLSSAMPTRTGYTFKGWATSASGSVAYAAGATYANNANITLYAVWEINVLSVKYNVNGGVLTSDTYSVNSAGNVLKDGTEKIEKHYYGKADDLTNASTFGLSRTGYTFAGWSLSKDGSTTIFDEKTERNGEVYYPNLKNGNATITLYAVWTPVTYTVTYNSNGGTGAPAAQTKTYGTALTLSSAKPTRDGYTFLGWATSSTATAAQYQPGGSYTDNAAVILYAVWHKIEQTPAGAAELLECGYPYEAASVLKKLVGLD